MFRLFSQLVVITILISPTVYAASIDDYVAACTANQNNNMESDLCECMANKAKELSSEEFDFFYAIAIKDREKVNHGHTTLEPQQKAKVLQLNMLGPSRCANQLATNKDNTNSQEPADASNSSAESTSDATSQ